MRRAYHLPPSETTPDRLVYVATLLAEAMRPDRPLSMNRHAAALLAGTARREGVTLAALTAHLTGLKAVAK